MLHFATHHSTSLPFFSVLPASAWLASNWQMQHAATPVADLDATPERLRQPAPEAPVETAAPLLPNSLRLGDYVIGDTTCPALYGHPDIRY